MSAPRRQAPLSMPVRRLVAQMLIGGVKPMTLVRLMGVSRSTVVYCAKRLGDGLVGQREELRKRFQKLSEAQLADILEQARLLPDEEPKKPVNRLFQMEGMQPVEVIGRTQSRVTYRRQNGTVASVDRKVFDSLYIPVR